MSIVAFNNNNMTVSWLRAIKRRHFALWETEIRQNHTFYPLNEISHDADMTWKRFPLVPHRVVAVMRIFEVVLDVNVNNVEHIVELPVLWDMTLVWHHCNDVLPHQLPSNPR